MKLIYSLNTDSLEYEYDSSNLNKLIKSYELSIKLAKSHYDVCLYTDNFGASKLGKFVDDVKILNKGKNYLWSEAKFEALSNENSECAIIDGDVFLTEKLKYDTTGIIFDRYDSDMVFDFYYPTTILNFDKYDIHKIFPYWNTNYRKSINTGILGFFDNELKSEYLKYYYDIKDWYFANYPKNLHKRLDTMIIGQYSLMCILNSKSVKTQPLSFTNNYSHFHGGIKYENFFVKMVDSYIKNEL